MINISKTTLADKLGVARSTLYYQSKKTEADELARAEIEAVMASNPRYGHRRVALALGWNKKKVRRLMKKFKLKPRLLRGQKWQKTSDLGLAPTQYQNLVKNWSPIAPDIVWYADFTYLKVRDTFLYLATVIDGYTKDVIGFALSRRHNSQLVKEATLEAVMNRSRLPEYFHTDQGSEYQAEVHLGLLEKMGIKVSMSAKSSPWQNPYQESFYSEFKLELGSLDHLTDGQIAERIYQQLYYYNHLRIHTTLKMSPRQFYALHKSV